MFRSKIARKAYKEGIKKGYGCAMRSRNRRMRLKKKQKSSKRSVSKKKTQFRVPKAGAYNMLGRIDENRVDDLNGPVVFWDPDFD